MKSGGSAPAPEPAKTPSLDEEIAAVQERLAEASRAVPAQGETGAGLEEAGLGIAQSEIDERRTRLGRLPRIYERQLGILQQLKEIQRARADLETQIAGWQGFEEKPPYAIDFVDGLREAAYAAGVDSAGLQTQIEQTLADLSDDQKSLDSASTALRLLSEKVEAGGGDSKEQDALLWRQGLGKIRVQFFGARVAIDDAARRLLLAQIELAGRQRTLAERQVRVAAAASPFPKAELDRNLKVFEARGREIRREMDRAVIEADRAADRLAEAREAMDRAGAAGAENGAPPADLGPMEDDLRLRQVEAQTARANLDTLKLLRDAADAEGVIWKQRFTQSHSRDPKDLAASRDLIARVKRIAAARRLGLVTRLEVAQSLASQESDRAAAGGLSPEKAQVSKAILDSALERAKMLGRGLQAVSGVESLVRNWQQEIAEQQARIPLLERLRAALEQSGSLLLKAWNFELFAVEDTILAEGQKVTIERGVTVGKILIAILILSLGILITIRLGRVVYRQSMRRFRARESAAALAEKLFLILFSGVAVVVALSIVRIPLTVFAFLGGALAIGAGFGAQNLINNFISGIILLVERPIKVGDLVDVEGVRGRVVRVGSRCSQVRRNDGIDLLIPNSAFLEKNVINWTLSDPFLRFSVDVGVAYGSPVEQVRDLLEKAVTSHPKVLKDRPPMVLFESFGDNALQFSIFFWLAVIVQDDYRITLSDIRFEIDKLFREAGIVIAFPQRDVHLSSDAPVEVRIVDRPTR